VTQTVNGLKTETKTPPGVNGGWVSMTINPDGTRVQDTYADGLLVDEKVLPVSGSSATTDTTYAYDGLRRLISKTDFRGTTLYTYFQDGTQKTMQEPGHQAVTVNTIDQRNNSPTDTSRADGAHVNSPKNNLGQTSTQAGAGVLPANFTYDTANTGQLTAEDRTAIATYIKSLPPVEGPKRPESK